MVSASQRSLGACRIIRHHAAKVATTLFHNATHSGYRQIVVHRRQSSQKRSRYGRDMDVLYKNGFTCSRYAAAVPQCNVALQTSETCLNASLQPNKCQIL